MSFARGLAAGLRPLPGVLLHNQRRADDQALGESITELTDEVSSREAEADPNFMGPPRAPVGEDNPELSRREQVRMTPAQTHQRMAGLYAKHGRPNEAGAMLDRGMRASEREDEREYRRGRDAKTDERYAKADERADTEFGWKEDDRRRQDLIRQGQTAYRALVRGDNDLASQIMAANGDYLAQELGLGPDRKVVGVERVGDRIALSIENSKTGSTGAMTERASADPDDQVISVSLGQFGEMVGIEPDRRFSDPKAVKGMGIGQFGPDGKWHSITSAKDVAAGKGGGASGMDSPEAARVRDGARTGVIDIFRTTLGENWALGDPENGELQAAASDAAYSITQFGYENGIRLVPNIVGNHAARIALSPEYAGLKRSAAVKLAEVERDALPRGERKGFDVQERAREIQNGLAQQHHMAVMTAVFGEPEAFGALPEGAGSDEDVPMPGAQPGAAASAPRTPAPQQRPVSPGGLNPVPAAGADRPRLTGETVTNRVEAAANSPARRAGLAVRRTVEQAGDRLVEFARAAPGLRSTMDITRGFADHIENTAPTPERIGRAARTAGEFVGGATGSETPAPPPRQAAGFFENVQAGRDPDPEQIEAAVIYDRENPGVLSDEERAALRYYVQQLLGSVR